MKRTMLLAVMLWMYGTRAQAPAGQPVSEQYPTTSSNTSIKLIDSVSGTTITDNVCDSLQAGFTDYPLNGLTVQFTNNSTVLGGTIAEWLWNFGDNSTASTPSPSHNYNSVGTYTVCLTIYENVEGGPTCQDSICNKVTVSYFDGVQDLSDNEVDVYPNPSNGNLIIRANTAIESYRIYNALGAVLDEEKFTGDVIHLPPTMTNGIYFIYLKTPSTTLIKKLLLQYQ